ncbi:MAG: hypothetical protein QXU81_00105 [Candidatus Bathyarchaeia archaeon]
MKSKIFLLILLPLLCSLFILGNIYAQEENFRANIPLFELYAPARVVVSFQYTQDVSIRVSTVGASLYRATTSPTQIQFEAENYDTYKVIIRIAYSMRINQTITIGLFEGGRAAKSIEIQVNEPVIEIQMVLSVVEAPRYPTAEEISERMWERWRNELVLFEQKQNEIINKMIESSIVIGSLAAIGFTVSLACIYAVFRVHHKIAELEAISKP